MLGEAQWCAVENQVSAAKVRSEGSNFWQTPGVEVSSMLPCSCATSDLCFRSMKYKSASSEAY